MEIKNFINEKSTTLAPPSGQCRSVTPSESEPLPKDADAFQDPLAKDAVSGESKSAKRRARRRGKRRRHHWKPYFKLTTEERKQLEIFEEKRAEKARELRFKHGFPVAPYNTTQFLLNDRQKNDTDKINVDEIVANIRTHTRSGSYESVGPTTSSDASTSDDEDICMLEQREFDEEYETANTERLESMSKTELIKDYVELEKEFDHIQRELLKKSQEIAELKQKLDTKGTDADTGQKQH